MARYLLHHRHQPDECGIVLASFKGHEARFATMRRSLPAPAAATRSGGRSTADSRAGAHGLLPFYVAQRTTVTRVSEVQIP